MDSRWEFWGQGLSSNVKAIFEYNSTFFASTELCGFASKSSIENTWNLNSDVFFEAYTIKGDSLFAVTNNYWGGMIRSLGIQLFDLKNPESPPISIIKDIETVTLAHAGTYLYGEQENYGFFRLNIDDFSFEYISNGLPTETIITPWGEYYTYSINIIKPTKNYIFCGTKNGIYRNEISLNNSWTKKSNGLPDGNISLIESENDTLYTSVIGKLFYSANNGNDWIELYDVGENISSFYIKDNLMLIGTENGEIIQSNDYGVNWISMNANFEKRINIVTVLDDIVVCSIHSKGVYYYHDGSWVDNNSGMFSIMFRSMAKADNNIIANTFNNTYKLESNKKWSAITPNVTRNYFGSVVSMNDTIFLSIHNMSTYWPYDLHFIMYSPDLGQTWKQFNDIPFVGDDPYRIICDNTNSSLYVYEDGNMFFTKDLGLTWTDISIPNNPQRQFNYVCRYGAHLFASCHERGNLFKLNNNHNWEAAILGLPKDKTPRQFAFCKDAIFITMNSPDDKIYISFDDGESWTNEGLYNIDFEIKGSAYIDNHLFVSSDEGIFLTSNFGKTWKECNEGLKNLYTSSIMILNDTLYVNTSYNGIWKRPITDFNLSLTEYNKNEFDFLIYPNPTVGELKIKAKELKIKEIDVFNLSGQKQSISNISDDSQFEYVIDVSHLSEGTYLLRIKTSTGITTKKFTIKK